MALVVVASVLWLLVALALLLTTLEAPRGLVRAGMAILGADFVLLVVAAATAECAGGPCVGEEHLTETSGFVEALVKYAMPGLTAAFTVYLIAYGLRRRER